MIYDDISVRVMHTQVQTSKLYTQKTLIDFIVFFFVFAIEFVSIFHLGA